MRNRQTASIYMIKYVGLQQLQARVVIYTHEVDVRLQFIESCKGLVKRNSSLITAR